MIVCSGRKDHMEKKNKKKLKDAIVNELRKETQMSPVP